MLLGLCLWPAVGRCCRRPWAVAFALGLARVVGLAVFQARHLQHSVRNLAPPSQAAEHPTMLRGVRSFRVRPESEEGQEAYLLGGVDARHHFERTSGFAFLRNSHIVCEFPNRCCPCFFEIRQILPRLSKVDKPWRNLVTFGPNLARKQPETGVVGVDLSSRSNFWTTLSKCWTTSELILSATTGPYGAADIKRV